VTEKQFTTWGSVIYRGVFSLSHSLYSRTGENLQPLT